MPHTLLFSLSLIADEDDDISSPSPGFSTRSRKRLWFVAFSLLSFCQPFPFFRQLTTSQLPSLPSSHSKPNPVSFQLVARRRARFLQTDLDPSSLFPSSEPLHPPTPTLSEQQSSTQCLLASLATKGNEPHKAVEHYLEALKLDPFNWEAFEGLCSIGSSCISL